MNGIVNFKELEKIDDEYGSQMKNTLMYMYSKFANKPYSFLYLKLRKNPAEAYQNFTKKINWKSLIKVARNYKITDVIENEEVESEEDI